MKYWLLSDTHFGHRNMERLCGRPSNFEDLICDSWKKNVGADDTLIHLGDVCFRYSDRDAHRKWVEPMPGRKILVRGNHDKKSCEWYMDHGWDFACDEFSFNHQSYHINFRHIPPFTDTDIGVDLGDIRWKVICGHSHQHPLRNPQIDKYQYTISLELQGYRVQTLDSVLRFFHQSAKMK